ncbi:MAG TPA: DUF2652 domain-containing protein [Candidatus Limnocylindrales bacterium]|jgi:hypothetical protein|nr:DUF2652 domain-containing protein [Candidatus Limnocylindrales bacterium]
MKSEPKPDDANANRASEQYFLLADISGYTAFLGNVEQTHGLDFSHGIPAGYEILGALLDVVVQGIQPAFAVAKVEGDAVFGVAPAAELDAVAGSLLGLLRAVVDRFHDVKLEQAAIASDHVCTACPVASSLWLKMLLHRGYGVQVAGGSHTELHGPAVTLVHRLLKNEVTARIGARPYLFVTDAAARPLGLTDAGVAHLEHYADAGDVTGRIVTLD